MPKEDYLLKYLEKLSRVIAAMLGLRDKGFPEDALRLADEIFTELLDFNTDELAVMPVDLFVETIRKGGYSATHLEIMAQLFHETAKSFFARGNEENADLFYMKTLQLYYLLNEKDKTFSFEREMLIDDLRQIIGQ